MKNAQSDEQKHINLSKSDLVISQGMLSKPSLAIKINKRVESLILLDSDYKLISMIQQVGLTYPAMKDSRIVVFHRD